MNNPAITAPTPIIFPITSPTMIRTPISAPVFKTAVPTTTKKSIVPVMQFVCDPPITIAKREELILSILNDVTPESEILTTGTSQNKAFDWVVNYDELKLCPNDIIDITQRYILAVTYYSLGGNNWFMCSAFTNSSATTPCIDDEHHLTKANVCDWFNVTCSVDGNITGIVLGKFNLNCFC